MQEHESLLQTIESQGHGEELERALLQVIATPDKRGQVYCDVICYRDPASGYFYRDFSTSPRNVLCLILKEWRESCGDSYSIPAEKVIELMTAKLSIEQPDVVTLAETPMILAEWREITGRTNPLLPVAQNSDVAGAWMKKQRFERAVRDSHYKIQTGGRKLQASQIVERLHKSMELADLSGLNTSSTFVSIDDILNPSKSEQQTTTFYSTGVPVLDKMLGGGYARGYSYLHVTGSGGGKSSYAAHITVNMAIRQDLKCLWISTEEPPPEVYYRLLSNFCNIPHEEIRKRLPEGNLSMSPQVQARFDICVKKMKENVLVKRWVNEDFNLQADLKMEVREFEQKMGCKPHYVIFDWLGASTTELASNNGVRNSLKSKAYSMDLFSKQEDILTLYFMQAGEQFKSQRFINQAHVDECKTAAAKCPAVIGWSFLPNTGETGQAASNGVHQDQQILSVGKSRFGKGGFLTFTRNFGVQRFEFPK